jgi:hypothetical protein
MGSDYGILHLKESVFLDLVHHSLFSQKNTTFRKLGLFPPSGKIKVAPTLLGPVIDILLSLRLELKF